MTNIEKLNNVLLAFKIPAKCSDFKEYKNAYFYDVELKPGAKLRDLEKYATELALALKAPSRPRFNVISDRGIVRFEFVNAKKPITNLFKLGYTSKRPEGILNCLIGETLEGEPLWFDLVRNPHMMIAGCTGSGKSTVLHAIIANVLLHTRTKLYLFDPKNIEFFKYEAVKNVDVKYTYNDCLETLELLCKEMDERYIAIKKSGGQLTYPYSVVIIDEFADLIYQDTGNCFYKALSRLAQKGRAAGIHIILSTQRPAANIVDGNIKANFPARISCKVATGTDSKVVLDTTGAEDLLGNGDAIIKNSQYNLKRFQAAFTTADEVIKYLG